MWFGVLNGSVATRCEQSNNLTASTILKSLENTKRRRLFERSKNLSQSSDRALLYFPIARE